MPFEPMSLPYWTVPSWNPNVNEARANGEYPTAAWANQLQALHDAEVAKINEVGALAESVSDSVGLVGEMHLPGTILIAGEDGYLKPLPPGTLDQVLQPNSNAPDGVEWRDGLPTSGAVKGSLLAYDGTSWVNLPVSNAANGYFLRYDTRSAAGMTWASSTTNQANVERITVIKSANVGNHWSDTGIDWKLDRDISGQVNTVASYYPTVLSAKNANYTPIPINTTVTFAVLPPSFRPSVQRALTMTLYNVASQSVTGNLFINTDGTVTLTTPAINGPFTFTTSTTPEESARLFTSYTL